MWVIDGDREGWVAWAFGMRTGRSRAERMASMRPSLPPPSTRRADLALAVAGVVLGLVTLALQRAVEDATWRDVDALAVGLVLLMTIPAVTCRRAPIASAGAALTAALWAGAPRLSPAAGGVSPLLIAGGAACPTHPPPA